MTWQLSDLVDLRNERVSDMDADRQQRTAAEILRRLNDQPGLVLADEVGMGKTYVALAVAVSVLEATGVSGPSWSWCPPGVADKWPTRVGGLRGTLPAPRSRACGHPVPSGVAATSSSCSTTRHPETPPHLHHSRCAHEKPPRPVHTTGNHPPGMLRRSELANRRRAVSRFGAALLADRRFDEITTEALLSAPISQWKRVWERHMPGAPLGDDPVPLSLEKALTRV